MTTSKFSLARLGALTAAMALMALPALAQPEQDHALPFAADHVERRLDRASRIGLVALFAHGAALAWRDRGVLNSIQFVPICTVTAYFTSSLFGEQCRPTDERRYW